MLSSLNRIFARIWAVFHFRDLDRQLVEELDVHIRLRTKDLVHQGIAPGKAERMARVELGGVTQLREAHREIRGLPFLDTFSQDLRYICRTLAKAPGFTAIAIATLALGIGITTVVFTVYAAIKFTPLPAHKPAEIVRLQWRTPNQESVQFSWSEYQRLAEAAHLFTPVFATSTPQTVVCKLFAFGRGQKIARVRFVSPNYFAALGVVPEMGRLLRAGESDGVVVSHNFWKANLGSDPAVNGKMLGFERGALGIVGVLPERFTGTGQPPQTPDIWIPASAQSVVMPGLDWIHDDSVREWQVLARQNSRMRSQAAAELAALSSHWPKITEQPVKLTFSKAMFFQTSPGAFETFVALCAILMVAVSLVLLIGCVNLTHLIAARNSDREREIALRLALGASRSRLIRQLCAEGIVLSMLGGAVGMLLSDATCRWLAIKSVELLRQITNGALGIELDLSPDWRVFGWTVGVSLLTGIGIAILPAMRAASRDLNSTLKQGTPGAGSNAEAARSRNLLLAIQVASCLILLAGAGFLFRGALRSEHISPGFEYQHLAVLGIDTQGAAASATSRLDVLRQAIRRMESIPAIASVAWADRVPFLGTGASTFENQQGASLGCVFNGVSDGYFATVGIRLLAGRTFRREEIGNEPPIAVISESTARRLWPGQSPIGQRIVPGTTWLRHAIGRPSLTVVGVVQSIRSTYLSKDDAGYVYLPRGLHAGGTLFLIRTRTAPDRTLRSLATALAGISPQLAARTFMSTMEQGPVRMQELMAQAPATVAFILGFLALLLACIGIYGVVSHFVARRTREIGIRIALGAASWDLIAAICGQTLRPVCWGAGVGLLGAFGISELLHVLIVMPDVPDLTYGAGAFDPFMFLCVLLLLVTVVFLAAFVPVWRATQVDAAVALRNE